MFKLKRYNESAIIDEKLGMDEILRLQSIHFLLFYVDINQHDSFGELITNFTIPEGSKIRVYESQYNDRVRFTYDNALNTYKEMGANGHDVIYFGRYEKSENFYTNVSKLIRICP